MSVTLKALPIFTDMSQPTHEEEAPPSPTAQTAPTVDMVARDAATFLEDWKISYDTNEPLYVEINIPLPPMHKQNPSASKCSSKPATKPRASTLQSIKSSFHRRGSSSDSTTSKTSATGTEAWPRIKKEVKSREVASAMNIRSGHRRSSTIDALAVVPAVLVLSAELFTPEEKRGRRRRSKDEGNWEDGWI